MRLQELEQHAINLRAADKSGLLSIFPSNTIHVMVDTLIEISQLNYDCIDFFERKDREYPYEVYIKMNGFTYFCLCKKDQLQEFGGGMSERIIRRTIGEIRD